MDDGLFWFVTGNRPWSQMRNSMFGNRETIFGSAIVGSGHREVACEDHDLTDVVRPLSSRSPSVYLWDRRDRDRLVRGVVTSAGLVANRVGNPGVTGAGPGDDHHGGQELHGGD